MKMKRLSKQINLLNCSQFVIALFFLFDIVICAKLTSLKQIASNTHVESNTADPADLSRPLASILSNYHSDAEQVLRSPNNHFENNSDPAQSNGQSSKIKYEQQLKIVKRSPRNYNFGLGKRTSEKQTEIDEKEARILDSQIRKLLNYLYNLDINLIWNYLSNMNEDEQREILTSNKLAYEDDDQNVDSLPTSEKYKSKRDTLRQFGYGKRENRQYSFGIGKRSFSTGIGENPRLDEYIKRRYSFGIGKRFEK